MATFGQIGGFVQRTASTLGITAHTKNSLGVNMPDGLIKMISSFEIGDEGTAFQNLGEALTDISVAGQFLYCFGEVITSPEAMFSMLSGMASNLCGTMAQVMNNITSALMMQVNMAIDGVLGGASRLINSVLSLINSVLDLVNVLVNLPRFLAQLASGKWLDLKKVEQCDEIVAAIMACLLNKLLGDPIQTFQNKMVTKINQYGYTMNQAIADEFYDLNVMSAYIEQESFFLTKASYQMQGLYADFGVTMDVGEIARQNTQVEENDVIIESDGNVKVPGTNTKVR